MNDLKGTPRVVAFLVSDHRRLVLLSYLDGSWGIRRDGTMVGVWEPAKAPDCIRAFESLCGAVRQVIVADVKEPVACTRATTSYELN